MSLELTYLNSPSSLCSTTVILPIGRLNLKQIRNNQLACKSQELIFSGSYHIAAVDRKKWPLTSLCLEC